MNLFKTCLAAALALVITGPAFAAANNVISRTNNVASTETWIGVSNAAATDYTNATTTASDITDASVSVPASKVAGNSEFLEVCFFAQASKATATTGTITPVSSDATTTTAIAGGARTVASSGGNQSVDSCYIVARATKTAFTIKLQGVSGDTNTFTVSDVQLRVRTFFVNS